MQHAAFRIRYLLIKKHLQDLGVEVQLSHKPVNGAINFYHKHYIPDAVWWIKDTGGIFDVTDDHFSEDNNGLEDKKFYYKMCEAADIITCPTQNMADVIKSRTGRDAEVVPDTIDTTVFDEANPEYLNTRSACWYGNKQNLYTLQNLNVDCPGFIVSNLKPEDKITKSGNWEYVDWSFENIKLIFLYSDIVLVPYKTRNKSLDSFMSVKSPNRIMNALYSGKIVVTDDNPVVKSYGLQDFVIIDDNIQRGIEWVWENPYKALDKVKKGQEYVKENYNAKKVAQRWYEVIQKTSTLIDAEN